MAKAKAKPKAKRAPKPAFSYAREPGLEAAIVEAPLDPVPRMVYADWLQAAGDTRGEWMALSSAMEADPTNVRLRSLVVDFLGRHAALLLGAGKSLVPGAWIGWRGGFIDELRVQPYPGQRSAGPAFAALLAHPSCRFVRHVALGDLPRLQHAIDALVAAAPPLLESVVICDGSTSTRPVIDDLVALPSVRRLGLHHATITKTLPNLVELCITLREVLDDWPEPGRCPNLESLTIDCRSVDAPVSWMAAMVETMPKLQELRLLHLDGADEVVAHLASRSQHLRLLDLSHSTLSDSGAERLASWKDLSLVAMRTNMSEAMTARLAERLGSVTSSRAIGSVSFDEDRDHDAGTTWLHHRLATDGRDGLRLFGGIALSLCSVGTQHSMQGRPELATPLLDAALTLPNQRLRTWAWANAAIAHERRGNFDEAELVAREGLLRVPHEPNLFAIVVDVLRRSNRLDEALALLPRAIDSITRPKGLGAHTGGPAACLADCVLVLQQAGRHADALELATEHVELLRPIDHASIAMLQVALGKVADARESMKATKGVDAPIVDHAKAVMALAARTPRTDVALAALVRAKAARYPEWHWIAKDPNLEALAGLPAFQALL